MVTDDDGDERSPNPPSTAEGRSILRNGVNVYRREGLRTFLSKAVRYAYYRTRDETKGLFEWPARRAYAAAYDSFDWYWERTLATSTAASRGRSVDFDGTTAVSTDRRGGLLNVWDLRDPTTHVLADVVPVVGANHVGLDGHVAYVTQRTGSGVLHAVDVSTPSLEATVELDGFDLTYGIDVDSDRGVAAVADRTGKVALIDVSDPTDLRVLDTIRGEQFRGATGVQFVGDSLVVSAKDTASLLVLDCSRPADVTLSTVLESDRLTLVDPVEYADGTLYTAAGSTWRPGLDADVDPAGVPWGLNAVTFEPPAELSFAGRLRTDDLERCYGIAVEGDYAYASSMGNGHLVVLDVSDAGNPVVRDIGSGVEFWNVHDVAVADGVGVTVSTRGRLTTFSTCG